MIAEIILIRLIVQQHVININFCDQHLCLSYDKICDKISDCDDGRDEKICSDTRVCSEEEFECFSGQCISSKCRCDGKYECKDESDEENCLIHAFLNYGAICDNGDCIYPRQLCNGIFDCVDLSYERACHPTMFEINEYNCILIYNDTCLPLNKLCNHIVDCIDGVDEITCGHESYCESDMYEIYDDHTQIYDISKRCDGFHDCLDGSDEQYCLNIINFLSESTPKCVHEDHFSCNSGQIICMESVCDGYIDCYDISDENNTCDLFDHTDTINITMNSGGVVLMNWITKRNNTEDFEIYVKEYDTNDIIYYVSTKNNSLYIKNHRNCHRYYIRVFRIPKIFRSLTYIYSDLNQVTSPFEITYNYITRTISWKMQRDKCLSRSYYVNII